MSDHAAVTHHQALARLGAFVGRGAHGHGGVCAPVGVARRGRRVDGPGDAVVSRRAEAREEQPAVEDGVVRRHHHVLRAHLAARGEHQVAVAEPHGRRLAQARGAHVRRDVAAGALAAGGRHLRRQAQQPLARVEDGLVAEAAGALGVERQLRQLLRRVVRGKPRLRRSLSLLQRQRGAHGRLAEDERLAALEVAADAQLRGLAGDPLLGSLLARAVAASSLQAVLRRCHALSEWHQRRKKAR